MKQFILLLFAGTLIFGTANAQLIKNSRVQTEDAINSVGNFSIRDGKMVWQKVFTSTMSAPDAINAVLESGVFETILNKTDSTVTGVIKSIDPMYKEAGYKAVNISAWASSAIKIKGHITYEFRDGRYRIIFKDIEILSDMFGGTKNVFGGKNGEPQKAEFFFLKKTGGFNMRGFREDVQKTYELTFIHNFEIKQEAADNW